MSSSSPHHTIIHPVLSAICAAHCPATKTHQYRGLPYAHIPGRFRDPILLNSLRLPIPSASTLSDATKWGAIPTQPKNAEEIDARILNIPLHPIPPERKSMDEFLCANLVVVAPDDTTSHSRLPVIVWAHGGAYKIGSANFAAYDMRNFVRHSSEIGKPVVAVSANHRVNSLGMTATEELGRGVEDGNWLLKDERVAPGWVSIGTVLLETGLKIADFAFKAQTVPTTDSNLIHQQGWIRHEDFRPNPTWCSSVLIGSCKDEWTVMAMGGGIEKYAYPGLVFFARLAEAGSVCSRSRSCLGCLKSMCKARGRSRSDRSMS